MSNEGNGKTEKYSTCKRIDILTKGFANDRLPGPNLASHAGYSRNSGIDSFLSPK